LKVILNPIKECYINQIVKSDIQNMTKVRTISGSYLAWCNGLLFYYEEFDSEYINKKQTEGIWYLQSFVYTECKEKIQQSKWNGYSLEVIDLTGYLMYEDLTKSILGELNEKSEE